MFTYVGLWVCILTVYINASRSWPGPISVTFLPHKQSVKFYFDSDTEYWILTWVGGTTSSLPKHSDHYWINYTPPTALGPFKTVPSSMLQPEPIWLGPYQYLSALLTQSPRPSLYGRPKQGNHKVCGRRIPPLVHMFCLQCYPWGP
jgi:hypothetical protein